MSAPSQSVTASSPLTSLAAHLALPPAACSDYQGALSPLIFSSLYEELTALTSTAGLLDLGYQAYLEITGPDRLRWLNGMVTNTIHGLQDGDWNASFLLNAQGRILGDANIYRTPDALVLQTSRSQIDRLTAHLDHFIIMDDVELRPLAAPRATIGVAGPKAPQVLAALGLHIPESGAFESATVNSVSVTIVHAHSPVVPRFEIWIPAENLADLWPTLQASAVPCGISAAEALRILQATPLYGVDIQERHLAQETGQTRMLNFNKGCYLGQEIVERVRSRATVHRNLHQFSVQNTPDSLEPGQTIEVSADGAERNPVGELTSLAHYSLPSFTGALALGVIRTEAVERKLPLTHSGGALSVLDTPPSLS